MSNMENAMKEKNIVEGETLFLVDPEKSGTDKEKAERAKKQYALSELMRGNIFEVSGDGSVSDNFELREMASTVAHDVEDGKWSSVIIDDTTKHGTTNKAAFQVVARFGNIIYERKGRDTDVSMSFTKITKKGVIDLGVIDLLVKKQKKKVVLGRRLLKDDELPTFHSIENEKQIHNYMSFVHDTVNQTNALKKSTLIILLKFSEGEQEGLVAFLILGKDWRKSFELESGKRNWHYCETSAKKTVESFLKVFPHETVGFVEKTILPFDAIKCIVVLPLRELGEHEVEEEGIDANVARDAVLFAGRVVTLRNINKSRPTDNRLSLSDVVTVKGGDLNRQKAAKKFNIKKMLHHTTFGNIRDLVKDSMARELLEASEAGDDEESRTSLAVDVMANRLNVIKKTFYAAKKCADDAELLVNELNLNTTNFADYCKVLDLQRKTKTLNEIFFKTIKDVNKSDMTLSWMLDSDDEMSDDDE